MAGQDAVGDGAGVAERGDAVGGPLVPQDVGVPAVDDQVGAAVAIPVGQGQGAPAARAGGAVVQAEQAGDRVARGRWRESNAETGSDRNTRRPGLTLGRPSGPGSLSCSNRAR